jgi:hypothetical protein
MGRAHRAPGGVAMRLTACSCGTEHLERIPRSWWMRVFTARRHYQCSRCKTTMFVPKVLSSQPAETTPQASPAGTIMRGTAAPRP